jgi:hypothetical protein
MKRIGWLPVPMRASLEYLQAALEQGDRLVSKAAEGANFLDTCVRLHALLGRKPWMVDVLEVDSETPPAWMTQEDQRADWCYAHVLRLQLLAALAERGAKP